MKESRGECNKARVKKKRDFHRKRQISLFLFSTGEGCYDSNRSYSKSTSTEFLQQLIKHHKSSHLFLILKPMTYFTLKCNHALIRPNL